jgi:hypothetical protein
MNSRNFFAELKRRNVYKVAIAYAVVGWLLVQVATQVFPFFEVPNWGIRLVVLIIAIGFPIALSSHGRSSSRLKESSAPRTSTLRKNGRAVARGFTL